MDELPASLIIVGGGVIGLEWASMLNDFGVQVTVVEAASHVLPAEDEDIAKEMQRLLGKRGVRFLTKAKVLTETYKSGQDGIQIEVELSGDKREALSADKMLVSVGRQPNVENIGLENTDVKLERGFIAVNKNLQTGEGHIYAIGDVIGGLQLAHAASHEGILAANHLAGETVHAVESHRIPRCVYTRPEAASIGFTEREAKERGHSVKTGKFPFQAIGKSLVHGSRDGFVKVIADAETNDILGVHMIGTHVTELIAEASLAQMLDATPWEVGQTIHPHPSLSEIMGEAMLAVDGKAIGM